MAQETPVFNINVNALSNALQQAFQQATATGTTVSQTSQQSNTDASTSSDHAGSSRYNLLCKWILYFILGPVAVGLECMVPPSIIRICLRF